MNSFRIGVIGVLVEYWGQEQAEGFLHYFEGWVIFMACLVILLIEMWLLGKIGKSRQTLGESFALELPEQTPKDASIRLRSLPAAFVTASVFILVATIGSATISEREEVIPRRVSFDEFPADIAGWHGRKGSLEQITINALKFDDYFIGDYVDQGGGAVNFYVAYYASQRAGESAHSPRSCLPGGGWLIKDLSQKNLEGVTLTGKRLRVNRTVIAKGDNIQIVYYWFQQRGRIITNEYLVKWYLLWDALARNRSDGALVRLTAFVGPDEDLADADRRLSKFAGDLSEILDGYIPD